jgi:hypothetical protein
MWNVRKQGGTQNLQLLQVVKEIWTLAMDHHIDLRIEYIPGKMNVEADELSRQKVSPYDDYRLKEWAVAQIQTTLTPIKVDLFASPSSAIVPRFVTRYPCEGAVYADAFSRPLPSVGGYAHPPPTLIPRLVAKVIDERVR